MSVKKRLNNLFEKYFICNGSYLTLDYKGQISNSFVKKVNFYFDAEPVCQTFFHHIIATQIAMFNGSFFL